MPRKLILDVDTGTDDAIAVMLAALHPDLELLACTTVNGNVEVHHCTENTLRVLDAIGRSDIPVYEGQAKPFARPDFPIPRKDEVLAKKIHPAVLRCRRRSGGRPTKGRSSSWSKRIVPRPTRSRSCPWGRSPTSRRRSPSIRALPRGCPRS
jgi:hypothetical protein